MKLPSHYTLEGSPFKRPCLETLEQPRLITLPTDMWNEVFHSLVSGEQNAGAGLSRLHCVCKAWDRMCDHVKVKLCHELPFECIFYLPRLKQLDHVAPEDKYMFKKWSEMTDLSYKDKETVGQLLEEGRFVDHLPTGPINFLNKYGSEITSLKLSSSLCGQLLEEFRTRLPRLEGLDLQTVSDSSYVSIGKMTQLKSLTVDQMAATEKVFQNIFFLPRLERLVLSADEPYALSSLSKLTNLTWLDLSGTEVEGDWLQNISALKKLNFLQINGPSPYSWEAISQLSDLTCLGFKAIGFQDRRVEEQGMLSICQLTKLEDLDLFFCDIPDESLKCLSALTTLENLRIKSSEKISKEMSTYLNTFTHLQGLDLFESSDSSSEDLASS